MLVSGMPTPSKRESLVTAAGATAFAVIGALGTDVVSEDSAVVVVSVMELLLLVILTSPMTALLIVATFTESSATTSQRRPIRVSTRNPSAYFFSSF